MTCIAVLMCNLCILVKYESFSSVASILNYNKNLNVKLQKQRGFYSLFTILYFNHENEKNSNRLFWFYAHRCTGIFVVFETINK